MEPAPVNVIDRFSRWISESITVKLFSIGFLVLLLLIPQSWIESLIAERQTRAESVVHEIAAKWSGEQTLTGPVLVIPFLQHEKIDKGKDGVEMREWRDLAFFLPEKLAATGHVTPQVLHRGIFEAAVYESGIDFTTTFTKPDFGKMKVSGADVLWKEAYLVIGISDLRGMSENPRLTIGNLQLTGEPSDAIGLSSTADTGITAKLPWQSADDFTSNSSVHLQLKGSTVLNFTPVGKTTTVNLEGPWDNPSFEGQFLPASRSVTATGFKANWNVLHFNRPFSQQWTGHAQKMAGSEFGVRLLIPVEQYQKSTRTAKYGILVILLTFVSLLMVEIIKKTRIHPFQYILVASALLIYYTLLLSLSEQLGYDWAYLAASAATVVLVGAYSSTFLRDRSTVTLFSLLLTFFYGFIFVIIQQQDYSLLLGSIGLFAVVGLVMYFSRNIRWYRETQ